MDNPPILRLNIQSRPLVGEINDAGRTLLAEASIVHAKLVELSLYVQEALDICFTAEGKFTDERIALALCARDYAEAIRCMCEELGDLVEWVDEDHITMVGHALDHALDFAIELEAHDAAARSSS